MACEPNQSAASCLDIVERILDRGIGIDASASVAVLGVNHTVDARVVVASIETYMRYAQPRFGAGAAVRPLRIDATRKEK